jgi:dolichyl-diphosphooligosaccharide--protein glycosyltransferase
VLLSRSTAEFDPWFNFRATQYLVDNGWHKFINWFDDRSWVPLGRPVGTTIYPGMQVTAAAIYRALQALGFDIR